MPLKFTEQGTKKKLLRADFRDLYNSQCSIQEASERNQSALWLGASFDFEGKPSTRMILSQDMVRELLPHLTLFAQTGYLSSFGEKSAAATATVKVGSAGVTLESAKPIAVTAPKIKTTTKKAASKKKKTTAKVAKRRGK